jgi:hypothetical protein
MSVVKELLGESQYIEYKKVIYHEIGIILENKKEFIQYNLIDDSKKRTRIIDICDFLYLEKDMENFNKMESILKILEIKENIES